MAFRWDNLVQRVHRVFGHEVVPTLQARWPDIPSDGSTDRPQVVYRLGPALRMDPLPTGRSFRANRLWVLDQLFTCESLVAAIDGTSLLLHGDPTRG